MQEEGKFSDEAFFLIFLKEKNSCLKNNMNLIIKSIYNKEFAFMIWHKALYEYVHD